MRTARVLGNSRLLLLRVNALPDSFQSCIQNGQTCLHGRSESKAGFSHLKNSLGAMQRAPAFAHEGHEHQVFLRCSNQKPARETEPLLWCDQTQPISHMPVITQLKSLVFFSFKGKFRASELSTLGFPASLQ